MGPIWEIMRAISGQNTGRIWATQDLYETGGQKPYGAQMGGKAGKIWGKCWQDLGPIWATHTGPIWNRWTKTVLGIMRAMSGQELAPIWVTHVGPILNRWTKTVWDPDGRARSGENVGRIWDPYGQPI